MASHCLREDFGAHGTCTPGFRRGPGALKNKFCVECRSNGILIEANRLMLQTSHAPRGLFTNSNGRSVWTNWRTDRGKVVQFRVICNNQKVAGSGSHPVILFREPLYEATAQLGFEPDWLKPVPTRLVKNGYVVASVAHATLILRKPGAKVRNDLVHAEVLREPEERYLTAWSYESNHSGLLNDSDDRDRKLSFDRQALAHTEADNTRLCDGYVTGVPPPPSGPPPGAAFGVPPPPPQGQPLSMGGSQGDSRPQNLPHSASAFSALALHFTRTIHVHAHLVSHFLVCLPRSLANKSDLEQLHKDEKANPRAAPRSNRRRHWALSPWVSARFEPAWLNARFDPTLGVLSCRAVHRAAARVTHVSISPVPPHPTPPHRLWGRYTIERSPHVELIRVAHVGSVAHNWDGPHT